MYLCIHSLLFSHCGLDASGCLSDVIQLPLDSYPSALCSFLMACAATLSSCWPMSAFWSLTTCTHYFNRRKNDKIQTFTFSCWFLFWEIIFSVYFFVPWSLKGLRSQELREHDWIDSCLCVACLSRSWWNHTFENSSLHKWRMNMLKPQPKRCQHAMWSSSQLTTHWEWNHVGYLGLKVFDNEASALIIKMHKREPRRSRDAFSQPGSAVES